MFAASESEAFFAISVSVILCVGTQGLEEYGLRVWSHARATGLFTRESTMESSKTSGSGV